VGHWNELSSCHVFISCINVNESEACGKKLLEMVIDNFAVTVFAMQRGVRGSTEFKDMFVHHSPFSLIVSLSLSVYHQRKITLCLNVLLGLL
jgi:hypothetical protein